MIYCGQSWTTLELVNADELAAWDGVPTVPRKVMVFHEGYGREVEVFDPDAPANPTAGMTYIDPLGNAHTPPLPARWPHCPLCEAPLHRIQESERWVCEPKPVEERKPIWNG